MTVEAGRRSAATSPSRTPPVNFTVAGRTALPPSVSSAEVGAVRADASPRETPPRVYCEVDV